MPGLRIASRSWQDHYASVVEKVPGQTRSLVDSCAFAQQEDGTISAICGDDLVGSSYRANMEVMMEKLHEALECNTGELVGVDADLAKEATFTKRTIRCVPDAGWELEETRSTRKRCCSGSSARMRVAVQYRGARTHVDRLSKRQKLTGRPSCWIRRCVLSTRNTSGCCSTSRMTGSI